MNLVRRSIAKKASIRRWRVPDLSDLHFTGSRLDAKDGYSQISQGGDGWEWKLYYYLTD